MQIFNTDLFQFYFMKFQKWINKYNSTDVSQEHALRDQSCTSRFWVHNRVIVGLLGLLFLTPFHLMKMTMINLMKGSVMKIHSLSRAYRCLPAEGGEFIMWHYLFLVMTSWLLRESVILYKTYLKCVCHYCCNTSTCHHYHMHVNILDTVLNLACLRIKVW